MLPDKLQHFYGNYFIVSLVGWPAAAMCSVAKECADTVAGHAFSTTDLVADGLGIIAALLNNKAEKQGLSPRIVAYLDWNIPDQELIFYLRLRW